VKKRDNDMKKFYLLPLLLCCVMLTPAHAQESWTEIGIYGLMAAIEGEAKVGIVTSDVDVSFNDILDNLDMGFMGFVEHRRGKWSFIGDVVYMKLSDDRTTARNPILTIKLDAEVTQGVAEGIVGYRVLAQDYGDAQFGIDLLGGARYNKLDLELGVEATLLGLTTSASLNPSEDWVDGVIGARVQYGHNNGWGVSAWADIGEGSDSSSYQLACFVSYRFKNNIRVFGVYRQYSFEYSGVSGANRFELDLDYSGPMLGASYRF
jgi:hypothetical protein